jgi:hypothetical protein
MRRSTRHWIAAGSVLLFAALIFIAYLGSLALSTPIQGPGARR